MKIIRNSEMKLSLIFLSALTVVFSALALPASKVAAVIVLVFGAAVTAFFFLQSASRYRKIERLTMDIDRVMHGDNSINISESREGELFVLRNEITKMLLCLREQNEELKKSRVFLADSIADISHQLRTPLTSINLVLSLLSDSELSPERRSELLKELSRLIAKTDGLVTVLLKISKIDAGAVNFAKNPVPLCALVSSAAEPLEVQLELKNQRLICEIGTQSILGDLPWLSEAVGNILKNCMEHSPYGGKIRITARETPIFTELLITDSGNGFEKEDLPHIFERFYKGKNSSDMSFGVGLALAQSIVTGHGGIIKAKNSDKGGAEFAVRFYQALPDKTMKNE